MSFGLQDLTDCLDMISDTFRTSSWDAHEIIGAQLASAEQISNAIRNSQPVTKQTVIQQTVIQQPIIQQPRDFRLNFREPEYPSFSVKLSEYEAHINKSIQRDMEREKELAERLKAKYKCFNKEQKEKQDDCDEHSRE